MLVMIQLSAVSLTLPVTTKDVYEKEHKIPNPNPNSLKSKW